MKKIVTFILTIVIICTAITPAFAATQTEGPAIQTPCTDSQDHLSLPRGQFGDFYYEKVVTGTRYFWSEGRRVSDNLNGGQNGGTISTNNTVTFSRSVSGNVEEITFSGAVSISSALNYSINVGANKTAYIAYRCYYMEETGIREKYSQMSGKVVGSNTYTIDIPQYGEYYLVYV